ncbi:FAD binding domain protein [Fusarium oxysporum f. sp. phaseoli]
MSSYQSTTTNGTAASPLKVLIAGAGIGGLSAAIALRVAGHDVEIFESSRFAAELGAAIHLPPNVNGVLRRFGLKPETWGANDTEWPWQLSHRVDLHEALKAAATSPDLSGIPAKLHLRSRVTSCDPAKAVIILENGQSHKGDLLVAADGVHSTLRPIISGENIPTFASGGCAFRFLVPISKAKANPITAPLVEKTGDFQIWEGKNRRLVIYPCRDNNELNFVCLHPDEESQDSTEGWNNASTIEHVLDVFDEYCQPMKTLLSMADAPSIKLWRLWDRRALNTWVCDSAALLGDAAHPFLPHQGQGGAQAIEDGAALGALFPLGTTPPEVPERLKLYLKARYERATMVQDFSRQMAFQTSDQDKVGGFSMNPMEFSAKNFDHDAFEHAQQLLS